MVNESKVLEIVKSITDKDAYFYAGTLFVGTQDSEIAYQIFDALCIEVTPAIAFGKCGALETSYDFI